ncbi:unnamed protein product, partial [Larinioides sclopetarius]
MEIFEYIFKVKSLASQVISLVKGFSIRSGKESKKANSFESNIREISTSLISRFLIKMRVTSILHALYKCSSLF